MHALRTSIQDSENAPEVNAELEAWVEQLATHIEQGSQYAESLSERYRRLGKRYERMVRKMDFSFLYNEQRHLFSVGYNLEESQLDRAHYDLLASEARLASLIAIAKGDVDHRHWFQLGRMVTSVDGAPP